MGIYRLFYRATDLMPRKEIVRTCKNIGKDLAQELKSGETVNPARVQELVAKRIGKKNAAKIEISDNFNIFQRYAEDLGIPKDLTKTYFEGSKSTVLPNPKTSKTLLSLRTSSMRTSEAVNTATHELEHALFKQFSPRANLEKLYIKLRGPKWSANYAKKYSQILNEKNYDMQAHLLRAGNFGLSAIGGYTEKALNNAGLHSQMKLKNETIKDYLNKLIQRYIENPVDPKLNLKILKSLRNTLKDESRAYKVGGASERYFDALHCSANQNPTKSEMMAYLYDNAISVLNKRIRSAKIERLKSLIFPSKLQSPKILSETVNSDGSITQEALFMGKKLKVTTSEVQDSEVPKEVKDVLDALS